MAFSRRPGRSRLTLILLVLASFTLLTLNFRASGPVNDMRKVVDVVFNPVRSAGKAVSRPFANAWDGAVGDDHLKKRNEQLQREIDEIHGEQLQNSVAVRENRALKEQLQLKQNSDIPTVAAQILSGPLTSFDSTLEINRGSGDGVRVGMAIETLAGLVGRVIRVTGGESTIQLITDPSFKMGIRMVTSGDLGIAQGGDVPGTIDVTGISTTSGTKRGDEVITSGTVGSFYPPDVAVGKVTQVSLSADRTSEVLTVTPIADLQSLTYVTVMLCDNNCS